jgi:hypothetical protein
MMCKGIKNWMEGIFDIILWRTEAETGMENTDVEKEKNGAK